MATLNPTPAVPSIPRSAFEQQVLKLARKALKKPLSYDEQGFLELVEAKCAAGDRENELSPSQRTVLRLLRPRPGQG